MHNTVFCTPLVLPADILSFFYFFFCPADPLPTVPRKSLTCVRVDNHKSSSHDRIYLSTVFIFRLFLSSPFNLHFSLFGFPLHLPQRELPAAEQNRPEHTPQPTTATTSLTRASLPSSGTLLPPFPSKPPPRPRPRGKRSPLSYELPPRRYSSTIAWVPARLRASAGGWA